MSTPFDTVKLTFVDADKDPLVPVTVIGYTPTTALDDALNVIGAYVYWLCPTGDVTDAVTPLGSPLTLTATIPTNPFAGVTIAVSLTEPPRTTIADPADVLSVNPGAVFDTPTANVPTFDHASE